MKTQTSNVVYFPDKVQEELFEILDDIFYYSVNRFDQTILATTEEIISTMNVSEELSERIFPQLVWWTIFCSPVGKGELTIYQQYLHLNKHKWQMKGTKLQEILVSWLYLNPGYYYVDDAESKSGRVFVFNDVFEAKIKIVGIYNKTFQAPKPGELISGLLLPMGDGIYTTQGGLFHISEHVSQNIVREILPYYEKHAISPNYQFNPHLYPSLITLTLKTLEKLKGGSENEH